MVMLPFSEGRKESALVKEMLLFDSTQHVRKVLSAQQTKDASLHKRLLNNSDQLQKNWQGNDNIRKHCIALRYIAALLFQAKETDRINP
jgi:hypothetical protein